MSSNQKPGSTTKSAAGEAGSRKRSKSAQQLAEAGRQRKALMNATTGAGRASLVEKRQSAERKAHETALSQPGTGSAADPPGNVVGDQTRDPAHNE